MSELALRTQFEGCRFTPYPYGWWDKKYRVMLLFTDFGKGFTKCNGSYWKKEVRE
jgi:hypothetical protein